MRPCKTFDPQRDSCSPHESRSFKRALSWRGFHQGEYVPVSVTPVYVAYALTIT